MAGKSKAKTHLKSQAATSSEPVAPHAMEIIEPPSRTRLPPNVFQIRHSTIVLDEDLAPRLGVTTKRLNEAVKRNIERFPPDWLFQLTPVELAELERSKSHHGGRRSLPWAFTEHGVVMAASVLKSPAAIQAMQLVVSVFVEARRDKRPASVPATVNAPFHAPAPTGLSAKIKGALDRVLDTIIDAKRQTTVREEAQSVMAEAIHSIKERLKKAGAEDEELAARATALLAEAEAHKAVAAKTRAETEQIELATLIRKLRLVLEVEIAMESGDISQFLGVLDRLGGN